MHFHGAAGDVDDPAFGDAGASIETRLELTIDPIGHIRHLDEEKRP
jgi:hypothetical protein